MKVFLVRHAEAQPYSSQPDRHLTEHGEKQARRIARFLHENGQFDPVEIWHSGLPRSMETAGIMKEVAAPKANLVLHEEVVPGADPGAAYHLLMKCEHSVAIVGHHPHLHELFAKLMGSESSDLWEIVKSGVVCINGHDFYTGLGRKERRWSIFWMISPRLLPGAE